MKHWSALERIALGAFLFWFACGLVFTVAQIGPATIAAWPIPPWLRAFVALCLRTGDPILILLAFANSHLLAAREWGPQLARRWAVTVLLLSFAIETCGALTGFPFGSYTYTDAFGPRLGVVPLTIPLAWHVVVTNALFMVRTIAPHLPRWLEAAGVGLLVQFYDMVLEPFATVIKDYWHWGGGGPAAYPPAQNYLAWFVIGLLLVLAFAPTSAGRRRDARPALILGATVALFLAALIMR